MAAVLLAAFAAGGWAQANPEERARPLYQQTRYTEALEILEPLRHPGAAASALLGQCYYMLEDYKNAVTALERAVADDPANSVYQDWLGRAYGRRAEKAFALTAASYALKAREHFEQAVKLNPGNMDAVDDLFEYYRQAPSVMGGGQEKAAQLSEQIRERAPALYHSMQARLAESRKEPAVAEQQLKQTIKAAPTEPGRLADLAGFLARQGRLAESDALFDHAEEMAPNSPAIKFQRARAYIDTNRYPEKARQLLAEYLNSNLTPEDPPRAEAQRLLQQLDKG